MVKFKDLVVKDSITLSVSDPIRTNIRENKISTHINVGINMKVFYSPDSYPLFPAGGFGNQCTTDRKRGTPHGGRIGLEKSTGNYQSV